MPAPNPGYPEPGRPTRAGWARTFVTTIIAASPLPRTVRIGLKTLSLVQRIAVVLFVGGVYVVRFAVNAMFKMLLFMKFLITAALVGLFLASVTSFGLTTIVLNTASILRLSVHSAVHDLTSLNVCNLPLASLAFPSCRLLPVASISHADFPGLLAIQHRALDELVAGSTTNSELVLNVKHAELAIRDLVVLVKASNLTTKDPLADTLSQFLVDAWRTGRRLQLLISKICGTVDHAITYNLYVLRLLETTYERMPTQDHVDDAILRSFEMSLASFATSISSIIMDATKVSTSLDELEEQLLTVHALCVQEAWDRAVVEDKLLWQLWTLLGGNRHQLRDLANRATVLQNVQQYRALASAYVSTTVQALTVVDADLTELHEQLTTQAVDFDHIPLEVQIKSLEQSLYRLKDSSVGEETGGRVIGKRIEMEKYLM